MTQPEQDRQSSAQEQRERQSEAAGNNQGQQDAYEQSGLSEHERSEGAGQPTVQDATPDNSQRSQADQDAYEQSGLSEYGRSEGAGGSGQPLGRGAPDDKNQARQS